MTSIALTISENRDILTKFFNFDSNQKDAGDSWEMISEKAYTIIGEILDSFVLFKDYGQNEKDGVEKILIEHIKKML